MHAGADPRGHADGAARAPGVHNVTMRTPALLFALLLTACATPADSAPSAEPAADESAQKPAPKAPEAPSGAYRDASVADLEQALPEIGLLLDVRTPKEFEGGHVPGARLIPVGEIAARIGELEPHRGEEIWVICQSGARSARAAALLRDRGMKVVNVLGGTAAWKAAGKPVE